MKIQLRYQRYFAVGVLWGFMLIGSLGATEQPVFKIDQIQQPVDAAYYIALKTVDPQIKAEAFIEIAGRYADLGQNEQAKRIFESLQALPLPKSKKVKIMTEVVVRLASLGHEAQAVKTVDLITQNTDRYIVVEYLFFELMKKNQFDYARQVIEKADGYQKKDGLVLSLIKAYAVDSQYERAENAAKQIKDMTYRDEAWVFLAADYAEKQQFKSALQTAEHISAYFAKQKALSMIAEQMVMAGQKREAVRVADQLDETMKGSVEGKTAWKLAMDGDFETAKITAQTIGSSLVRNQAYANIAIEMAIKREYDPALGLAQQIDEDDVRRSALGRIAKQMARDGEFEDAFSAAQAIDSEDDVAVLMPQIGGIFGTFSQSHYPLLLINQIQSDAVRYATLKQYVISYAGQNDFEKLNRVIQDIKQDSVREETLLYVFDRYMLIKKYDLAAKLLRLIQTPDARALRLSQLAEAVYRKGDQKQAAALWNEAVTVIRGQNDPFKQVTVLVVMARDYYDTQQVRESGRMMGYAWEAASKIPKTDDRLGEAYKAVALSYALIGERRKALGIIGDIHNQSEKMRALTVFPMIPLDDRQKKDEARQLQSVAQR